jgi:5S rRNA maturation endonuclease (ribonuclease M5)|tara:strand:+ start:1406 stop:1876 length:471 start_codon:yes stop_codon:yes gene_type:complete
MSLQESSDNRRERFIIAAKSIQESIIRNRNFEQGGSNCPILVEGLKDVRSLRELGFSGTIETINRGWDRSRMIAYLYEEYGSNLAIDGLPNIILLMDWDRTGNRLQNSFKKRLESMDVKIDDRLRSVLSRQLKSECRTVESLSPHSDLFHQIISEL